TFWKGGSAPNTAGKSAPRKSMPIVCRRNQSKLVLSLLLKSPISTPTFNVRTVSHVKVEETKFGGLIARYRMFVSGFIQLVFVAVISGVTGKYTSVPSGFRTTWFPISPKEARNLSKGTVFLKLAMKGSSLIFHPADTEGKKPNLEPS